MTNLKHLTKEEREKITVLQAQYYSLRQIAKEIGRSMVQFFVKIKFKLHKINYNYKKQRIC